MKIVAPILFLIGISLGAVGAFELADSARLDEANIHHVATARIIWDACSRFCGTGIELDQLPERCLGEQWVCFVKRPQGD